jgi:integration host factor subunit alpha
LTKAEITESVYQVHGGLSKQEAGLFVDKIFEILKEKLTKHQSIRISGFGTFTTTNKIERIGRNPQTGEKIKIASRKAITFKPSKDFVKLLNTEKKK